MVFVTLTPVMLGLPLVFESFFQFPVFTQKRNDFPHILFPHLRLCFVNVGRLLRNLWVWLHRIHLSKGAEQNLKLHLERLRFRQMLDSISHEIVNLLNDSQTSYNNP
jgi:hypothetical protein